MIYSLRTIAYFLIWGVTYGLVLGAFAGTAIFPYFGTMYSVMWGTGIGAGCGLLTGLIAAVIHAITFHPHTDLDTYRRRLSLGVGLLNLIAAPALLIATTQGFLWGTEMMADLGAFSTLSIVSAAFWGSLSAAYTASYYPAFMVRLTTRREYEDLEVGEQPRMWDEMRSLFSQMFRLYLNRWLFLAGTGICAMLYAIASTNSYSQTSFFGALMAGLILGAIGTFFFGFYICIGNTAFIAFQRRLIFREYFPQLSQSSHRSILTVSAFIFTAATSYWTFIGAFFIALLMAALVHKTLTLDEAEKGKRKEKHALAVEEGDLSTADS